MLVINTTSIKNWSECCVHQPVFMDSRDSVAVADGLVEWECPRSGGPDDCRHNTLLPWGKNTHSHQYSAWSVVQMTADTTLSFPGEKTCTSMQCLECGPDDCRHNTLLPWGKNTHSHRSSAWSGGPDDCRHNTLLPWGKNTHSHQYSAWSVVQMTANTTLLPWGKNTHINTVPGVWSRWLPTQHSPSLGKKHPHQYSAWSVVQMTADTTLSFPGKKHTLTSIQCLECGPDDCQYNTPSLGKNTHSHQYSAWSVVQMTADTTLSFHGEKHAHRYSAWSVVQMTADTTLSFPGEKTCTSMQCLECGPDDCRHNTLLPWGKKHTHIDTVPGVVVQMTADTTLEGPQLDSALALPSFSLKKLWLVDTVLWLCPSQLMKY